jgi:uncharacterized protein YgbK (DUF1537 family)
VDESSLWQAEVAADERPTVIVDDDPTGTQAVSDVDVILRPDRAAFEEFAASGRRSVFVLSNSRALPEREAARLVGDIAGTAAAAEPSVRVVLRGDSTLRGHVFAEADAVAPGAPMLFVPAFLDGGRFTEGGVHRLRTPDGAVPVADTEFARDPVFGYRSRDLAGWVEEVSGGRRRASGVPLARLREDGPDAVADALVAAEPETVVVPDCAGPADDGELAGAVRDRLAEDGRALLATDRTPGHDRFPGAPEELMDRLVATVRRLAAEVDLVVAKGGITSARLATDALSAASARVRGQILPGVPVWSLRTPLGEPSYVVVPGNVGADDTLRTILDRVASP